ncbi:MAG: hypothetical protein ABI769_19515 [Pseudomonadota bacterium]
MNAVARPRSFVWLALGMSAFIVIAFTRTFYLRPLSDLPPLSVLMQVHGAVFTAWLAVFIAQTRLIANRRVDLHMRLGFASMGLAALVVVMGLLGTAAAVASRPVRPTGLTGAQFAAIPITTITLFGLLVTLGLVFRRRAALHKRFMVLAMIAVIAPATSRLIVLLGLRDHSMAVQLLVPSVFVGWCLWTDWRAGRGVHWLYVVGGLIVVASWPIRQMVAVSDWWLPIGQWIARVGATLI